MSVGTTNKLSKLTQLRLTASACKDYIDGRLGNIIGTVYDALVEINDVKADKSDCMIQEVCYTSELSLSEYTSQTNGDGRISFNAKTAKGIPSETIILGNDYKSEKFKKYKYALVTLLTLNNEVQTVYIDLNALLSIPYTSTMTSIDTSFGDCKVKIHKQNCYVWNDNTDSNVVIDVSGGYLLRVAGYRASEEESNE